MPKYATDIVQIRRCHNGFIVKRISRANPDHAVATTMEAALVIARKTLEQPSTLPDPTREEPGS